MFSEEEVKEAIFQMEHDKASLPNGFPLTLSSIYQLFWELIKVNLIAMFCDFYKGDLPSLNLGIITLLTKCQEAIRIQDYRLICHLNVKLHVFFAKVATSRMSKGSHTVIWPTQYNQQFLPGHLILEGA